MSQQIHRALAFVTHISSGKGQVHFETILGVGNVPEQADFCSPEEKAIERCHGFLDEMQEQIAILWNLVAESEQAFLQAKEVREDTERARKINERAQYLPGLAPEETEIDTSVDEVVDDTGELVDEPQIEAHETKFLHEPDPDDTEPALPEPTMVTAKRRGRPPGSTKKPKEAPPAPKPQVRVMPDGQKFPVLPGPMPDNVVVRQSVPAPPPMGRRVSRL